MDLPLSEPVPLLPGMAARLERLHQPAGPTERFAHFHGPAELVLMREGSGTFACEDRAFDFGPGMILYAPSMAVHDFSFAPQARTWTLIQFDPRAASNSAAALPNVPLAITPDAHARARIAALTDWLAESIAQQRAQTAVVLQLQALVLAIAEATGDPGRLVAASPLARFRPLLDRLDRDPAQSLRLAQAASLCAMSPGYFSRAFSRAFGIGFSAYQTRLKLQLAARQLATSDAPVSQVAWQLGFRSHAYFTHVFKTEFGVAPSCYRQPPGAQPIGR